MFVHEVEVIDRFVQFGLRLSLVWLLVLIGAGTALSQDLPFDPAQINQLTPDQRQKALEALGMDPGTPAASLPDAATQVQRNPSGQSEGHLTSRRQPFQYPDDCYRSSENPIPVTGGNRMPPGEGYYDDFTQVDRQQRKPMAAAEARLIDPRCANLPNLQERDQEAEGSRTHQPLEPFGYRLFTSPASTFAPATNIPIPADYVLGPGDTVRVQLYGGQSAAYSLVVGRDGQINFPKLGPIAVAGRHFDDVRGLLESRVAQELIGVHASISLGELRSIQVFLLGDVNQPGSYTVSSLSTITNALIVGGGVSLVGSMRDVQLKRAGHTVEDLDLYDLLLRGDSSYDQRLLPGDVIFVPPVGPRVSVDGEVRRPAIYELKGSASVGEVLKLAGGLMGSTNTSAVQLKRYDRNQKQILTQVDAAKPADLAMRVQDSDFIRVRKLAGPLDNNVRILGFVRYPGPYEWSPGYDLAQLLRAAQVLPSETGRETYLPLGLIQRTDMDTGVRGWLGFNVHEVLEGRTAVPLQRDDLAIILSRKDVEYLSSPAVRAVASGDFGDAQSCRGLQELAALVNSQRSIRFAKAFSQEPSRNLVEQQKMPEKPEDQKSQEQSAAAAQNIQNQQEQAARLKLAAATAQPCPEIFAQVPRALPYLLDESAVVYGEVRRPGLYPIAADTPLKMLVESAGGLTRESDAADVEYVSYDKALKSGRSSYEKVDMAEAGSFKVGPGDMFNFKPLYLGQEVGTVKAVGEFRFPATYGILRGERLSELMKRAGGLTDSAYPYGAVFTRTSARRAEQDSYRREANELQGAMVTAVTSGALGNNAQVSSQFLSTVVQRLQNAEAVGRVVIQADPTVLQLHPELDPILEPGDAIYMPKRPVSVTVIGEVLNPGTLEYMPNLSFRQYVDRAGGFGQAADGSRVFVILPNGTAQKIKTSFWASRSPDIPPGSVVVVPRDAAPFNTLAFSERVFGILSNLAVSAAALVVIGR